MFLIQFFWKSMREREKTNKPPKDKHSSSTEETWKCDSGIIDIIDFIPKSRLFDVHGLPSHSQREKYCLITWPERKQHALGGMYAAKYLLCLLLTTTNRFPVPVEHKKSRKFQTSLLSKYPWLVYSPQNYGGFCLPGVLFTPSKRNNGQLVFRPLKNWTQATCKSRCDDLISFALTERWIL